MGRKVFVTGGSGYVGGALVKKLEEEGFDYLAVDVEPSDKVEKLDLTKEEEVEKISDYEPDVLIHCATLSAKAYADDMKGSFTFDLGIANNLLEALPKDCRVVYFSSSYVYSNRDEEVDEESPLNPEHNFGVAKAFFEKYFLELHPESVVFRLSSLFGPGNSNHPNALLNMAEEARDSGEVTVWGEGKRKMQYIYIEDVAGQVLSAFDVKPGIYNLAGDDYVTLLDAAEKIADFFGAKVKFLKDKKEGETLPFMKNDKLKEATGKGFTPLGEAMEEYFKSLK